MDFVSDALFDGRRIRALTLVDNFTRESLAIEVGQGLRGEHVVAVLDQIVATRGVPRTIRADNGPEFEVQRHAVDISPLIEALRICGPAGPRGRPLKPENSLCVWARNWGAVKSTRCSHPDWRRVGEQVGSAHRRAGSSTQRSPVSAERRPAW